MDNFKVDVTSSGDEALLLALRLGFRNGERVATHVLRNRIRGLVLFDFRGGGSSTLVGIERLNEPAGPDGVFPLAKEWLERDDTGTPEAPQAFRVFCCQGGDVWNEPYAFLAINYTPAS